MLKFLALCFGVLGLFLICQNRLKVIFETTLISLFPFSLFLTSFTILIFQTTLSDDKPASISLNFIGLLTPLLYISFYEELQFIFNGYQYLYLLAIFLSLIINFVQINNYFKSEFSLNKINTKSFLLGGLKKNLLILGLFTFISFILIPLFIGISNHTFVFTTFKLLLNNKIVFFIILALLTIIMVFFRKKSISQRVAIRACDALVLFTILGYTLLTKHDDYFSGSFSLLSPPVIVMLYYLSGRIFNKDRVSRTDAYLLIFSSLINYLLFKTSDNTLPLRFTFVLLLVAGVVLLLASKKFYKFNLSSILISGIIISVYFVLCFTFNIISEPTTRPLDLLFLSQHYSVFDYYGGKANYPVTVLYDLIFILKNFLNENHIKTFNYHSRIYTIRYTYSFVVYFLIVSFHFMIIVILSKFISLIFMQLKLIEEIFKNRKNKIFFKNEINEDVSNLTPSIVINNLEKKYEKNSPLVLQGLSVNWQGNKIIGLLGNNGAGKSTLIKVLSQKITSTTGSVCICDKDLSKEPAICKKLIGYLPDMPGVEQTFTGREYLYFIIKINNLNIEDLPTKVDEMAKRLDILHAINRPINSYSFGMKQKIALMSVLLLNNKILILDEPFTGLDPITTATLHQELIAYTKRGNMVIFSSHIIEIVNGLCDEIYFLYNGKIIDNHHLKEFRKTDQILENHCMKLINEVTTQEENK